MAQEHPTDISSFFIAGINYKKTDASIRGRFSINTEQHAQLVQHAAGHGITHFFVLSTCNRTEIYGFAENVRKLSVLLCSQAHGSLEDFTAAAYTKQGLGAIEHLFNVAAGLDSQLLGDYEIVGQIKQAAGFSKQHHSLGVYLERLVNEVLQCAKSIRTNTELSGGTVSVSFAAVQYIRQYFTQWSGRKILLLGTGKIGSSTCKNMVDYLPGSEITLINRSVEKAQALAEQYGLAFSSMETLPSCIDDADIILVATNAGTPIILPGHFKNGKQKLLIDLSVPCNVDAAVKQLPGITLKNVDELSKIKDETLQKRKAAIPKAKAIIKEHIHAFTEWHEMRRHVPVLKAVKDKLETMYNLPPADWCATIQPGKQKGADKIQKVITGMAVKMKTRNQRGCHYIEAINDFITPSSN